MKKTLLVFMGIVISLLFLTTTGYAGYLITQILDSGRDPDINNSGQVVWEAFGEIFLNDGTAIIQLTDNDIFEGTPQINDNGFVTWNRYTNTPGGVDLFLYNGTTTTQLTDNNGPGNGNIPSHINNNGQVVWYGTDGNDFEIFLYDGTSTTKVTDNEFDDAFPDINDYGNIINLDL